MTNYLKHITVEQVREIAALSDRARQEYLSGKSTGPDLLPEDMDVAAALYHHLSMILLKDPAAYAELMVLLWIGTGTYGPRDFEEQVLENTWVSHEPTYLINKAPMGKYLETGLWALGYPASPDPERIDEYRLQRWTHGDPDHPVPPPPFTKPMA